MKTREDCIELLDEILENVSSKDGFTGKEVNQLVVGLRLADKTGDWGYFYQIIEQFNLDHGKNKV